MNALAQPRNLHHRRPCGTVLLSDAPVSAGRVCLCSARAAVCLSLCLSLLNCLSFCRTAFWQTLEDSFSEGRKEYSFTAVSNLKFRNKILVGIRIGIALDEIYQIYILLHILNPIWKQRKPLPWNVIRAKNEAPAKKQLDLSDFINPANFRQGFRWCVHLSSEKISKKLQFPSRFLLKFN